MVGAGLVPVPHPVLLRGRVRPEVEEVDEADHAVLHRDQDPHVGVIIEPHCRGELDGLAEEADCPEAEDDAGAGDAAPHVGDVEDEGDDEGEDLGGVREQLRREELVWAQHAAHQLVDGDPHDGVDPEGPRHVPPAPGRGSAVAPAAEDCLQRGEEEEVEEGEGGQHRLAEAAREVRVGGVPGAGGVPQRRVRTQRGHEAAQPRHRCRGRVEAGQESAERHNRGYKQASRGRGEQHTGSSNHRHVQST